MSSSFQSFLRRPDVFLVTVSTIIILIAIAILAAVHTGIESPFSQVIAVGPIWSDLTRSCTSDADFMVHGTIRSLGDAQLAIAISGHGTQSLYTFHSSQLYSFSVGAGADETIAFTRTGTVTGFFTLQTTSGAIASCT